MEPTEEETLQGLLDVFQTINGMSFSQVNQSKRTPLSEVTLKEVDLDWPYYQSDMEDHSIDGMPRLLHPSRRIEADIRRSSNSLQDGNHQNRQWWLGDTNNNNTQNLKANVGFDFYLREKSQSDQKQEISLQNQNLTLPITVPQDMADNQSKMSQKKAPQSIDQQIEAFKKKMTEFFQEPPRMTSNSKKGLVIKEVPKEPVDSEEKSPKATESCIKLRQLSLDLCRVLALNSGLTHRQAVEAIFEMNVSVRQKQDESMENNRSLKRRVYDCINVMLSCDAIVRENKLLQLSNRTIEHELSRRRRREAMYKDLEKLIILDQHRIILKKQKLRSLIVAYDSLRELRARNMRLGKRSSLPDCVWIPSVLIQAKQLKRSCANMVWGTRRITVPFYCRYNINCQSMAIKCLSFEKHFGDHTLKDEPLARLQAQVKESELEFHTAYRTLSRSKEGRQLFRKYMEVQELEEQTIRAEIAKMEQKQEVESEIEKPKEERIIQAEELVKVEPQVKKEESNTE